MLTSVQNIVLIIKFTVSDRVFDNCVTVDPSTIIKLAELDNNRNLELV